MSDFLAKPIRQQDLFNALQHAMLSIAPEEKDEREYEDQTVHLDMSRLDEQAGDDPAFLSFFLNLVIKEISSSRQQIEDAKTEKDVKRIKELLHKLRGTSSTAGLIKLAEMTKELENNISSETNLQESFAAIEKEMDIGLKLIAKILNK